MGDAADELWDSMMESQFEWDMAIKGAIDACKVEGKPCRLVEARVPEIDEFDDWAIVECLLCGKRFS